MCQRLAEENRSLRVSQEQLSTTARNLLAKNEQARSRVRSDDRAFALAGEQRVSERNPVAVNILDREFLIGCTARNAPASSPLQLISTARCARCRGTRADAKRRSHRSARRR
jgi:hypothetical protein